ncbi:hypothetical protein [Clostridium sp. DJ247]|uniref:hypothetical protein n=1 Tax=Clostridium sp. DJ247 TaxID=2726188 RepID=UPI001F4CBC09|nr:hypothetical protein [Clostridium sp. DJ247]
MSYNEIKAELAERYKEYARTMDAKYPTKSNKHLPNELTFGKFGRYQAKHSTT